MKYRFGGKEKRLPFGVYPSISLASARVTFDKLKWIIDRKLSPHIGRTPVSEITSAKLPVPLRLIEIDGLHETASSKQSRDRSIMLSGFFDVKSFVDDVIAGTY